MKTRLYVGNISGREIDCNQWRLNKVRQKIFLDAVKFNEIFSNILPGFGINHSKVLRALFDGGNFSAIELIDLTEVSRGKIYSVLTDLIDFGLIQFNGSSPKLFFIKNSKQSVQKIFSKKVRELSCIQKDCFKLFDEFEQNSSPRYVLDPVNKKIYHHTTKTIPLPEELRELKKVVDEAIAKTIPTKYY